MQMNEDMELTHISSNEIKKVSSSHREVEILKHPISPNPWNHENQPNEPSLQRSKKGSKENKAIKYPSKSSKIKEKETQS